MAYIGSDIEKVLQAAETAFTQVVYKSGVPLTEFDLNFTGQVAQENLSRLLQQEIPSGFLIDPISCHEDFKTHPSYSNLVYFGDTLSPVWAHVNGWLIPLAGTFTDTLENQLRLYPAPASGSRFDFVFLEVWQSLVRPNPSNTNKPSEDAFYRFGNTQYGGTNISDDLVSDELGFETSRRVQIQYRIRVFGQGSGVGSEVAFDVYPEPLDDPNILGQGNAASPVGGFTFSNMRTSGDVGLWRAGDGDPTNTLNTVDGYVYAIPLCVIKRRNTQPFVHVNLAGNPNHEGSLNRNPSAVLLANPLAGVKAFTSLTLNQTLTHTTTGAVSVTGLSGSGLDDPEHDWDVTYIKIGGEIISISGVSTINNTITITQRGRFGTDAVGHSSGEVISFHSSHPEGLFADQITQDDIIDLRKSIAFDSLDSQKILAKNLISLLEGSLKTTWKTSLGAKGASLQEVSYLRKTHLGLNQVEEIDGPDGIRTVWSDAAALQQDITIMLDNEAELINGFTSVDFNSDIVWDVAPDFVPTGFMNHGGVVSDVWTNGSVIFLDTAGGDGLSGLRGSSGGEKVARLLAPKEYWKSIVAEEWQHPFSLRFPKYRAFEPPAESAFLDKHPGPMYPLREFNFETPFIVLGDLLHPSLKIENVPVSDLALVEVENAPSLFFFLEGGGGNSGVFTLDVGVNFNTLNGFYSLDSNGNFEDDPLKVATPLLNGTRTLYSLLTAGGTDTTGHSSELYVITYGDHESVNNNGAWKVIGAGTVGYTQFNAPNATSLILYPLDNDVRSIDATGNAVTVEFRTQDILAEGDGNVAVVLTDIGGRGDHRSKALRGVSPWSKTSLGDGGDYDNSLPDSGVTNRAALESKLILNMTAIYHPGRGGTARVPSKISKFARKGDHTGYLRQAPGLIDDTFEDQPRDEAFYDFSHLELWNRLPAKGLPAPKAKNKAVSSTSSGTLYGGNTVRSTEQSRESELFVDFGSKTLLFRPFRERLLTLTAISFVDRIGLDGAEECLFGDYSYADLEAKDAGALFTGTPTTGKNMAYAIPYEFMPRFGRQDIPYFNAVDETDRFLPGVNHLFVDNGDTSSSVFNIIGGANNNTGDSGVFSLFFRTNNPDDYTHFGTEIAAGVNVTGFYEARKTTDIDSVSLNAELAKIRSSDLEGSFKGIQLPPYLGIARLYGVYEIKDFKAKGGETYEADRVTPVADPPINLLRTDVSKQTLYIMNGGASDKTENADDHTYIIPSHILDLTRIPADPEESHEGWQSDSVFEDFDYVVECVVFGFARGFINKNNYVMIRNHNGDGDQISDSDVQNTIDGLQISPRMVVPCPAGNNHDFFVSYVRNVYQGDPFMSRGGGARVNSDYEPVYGGVDPSDVEDYAALIQFDEEGSAISTPKKRGFEVLASLDFYTSLGTGGIGGATYPSTPTDIGRLASPTDLTKGSVVTRAFTEGQKSSRIRSGVTLVGKNTDYFGVTNYLSYFVDPVDPEYPNVLHYTTLVFTLPTGKYTYYIVQGDHIDDFQTANPGVEDEFIIDPGADDITLGAALENVQIALMQSDFLKSYISIVLSPSQEPFLIFYSRIKGAAGNEMMLEIKHTNSIVFESFLYLLDGPVHPSTIKNVQDPFIFLRRTFFSGGYDIPVNGGNGNLPISLNGMTERLPLGLFFKDYHFIGEALLGGRSSPFEVRQSSVNPPQGIIPLNQDGFEYSLFLGKPGDKIVLCDSKINQFDSVDTYRVHRGSACYAASGDSPGAPITWRMTTFEAFQNPILKSCILAGKALLVKNSTESPFETPASYGNEIQMIVITSVVVKNGSNEVVIQGSISPSGYGEGYAACDRYLIQGRPTIKRSSAVDLEVVPAPHIEE